MTLKKLKATFYRSSNGAEPVREWLKALPPEDRRNVGVDIATVEYGWPVGMPTCRPLGNGIWEVRSSLTSHRIARVLFCIADGKMMLLHGFIKKTQATPKDDLALAETRRKELKL